MFSDSQSPLIPSCPLPFTFLSDRPSPFLKSTALWILLMNAAHAPASAAIRTPTDAARQNGRKGSLVSFSAFFTAIRTRPVSAVRKRPAAEVRRAPPAPAAVPYTRRLQPSPIPTFPSVSLEERRSSAPGNRDRRTFSASLFPVMTLKAAADTAAAAPAIRSRRETDL